MFQFNLYWIKDYPLAIGPCPSAPHLLPDAVTTLQQSGVSVVVSLQTEREAAQIGIAEEPRLLQAAGIDFWRYGIIDHSTPPFTAATFDLVDRIAAALDQGQKAYLHCYAGIGRSATIAAAVLIRRGASAEQALLALRNARGFVVPETQAQHNWIYDYETYRQSQ